MCLASGTIRLNLVDGGGYLLVNFILSHKTETNVSSHDIHEHEINTKKLSNVK